VVAWLAAGRTPRRAESSGGVARGRGPPATGGLGWTIDVEDLTHRAEEALYTAVGLGILGFQHLQVRRRELARSLEDIVRQVTDPRPGAGPSR